MGRKTSSTQYIQPYDNAGNAVAIAPTASGKLSGRGCYALQANNTYYFPFGGQDARVRSVELEFDPAIVITSANIEDTNVAPAEANDFANRTVAPTSTAWVPETPSSGYVAQVGGVSSNANSTIGTNGSGDGAAIWNVADVGTRRGRLAVVVGATGGTVRVSIWGEE